MQTDQTPQRMHTAQPKSINIMVKLLPFKAITVKRGRTAWHISVKTTSYWHLHLLTLRVHTVWPNTIRSGSTTGSHNFRPIEKHTTATSPAHAMLSFVFAICACVNYHNKPANSACRSVADTFYNSHQKENISNNSTQSLIVHKIPVFFQYSTPTVTTDTTVYKKLFASIVRN